MRGFTKHRSSGVKDRGTFGGIREKIPYLKELGVTAVELLPVTEFDEVMVTEPAAGLPGQKPEATGRINYWGYGPSFLYALKASYGSGRRAGERIQELVKALHRENMECILEFYFTGKESPGDVLHVLRYWLQEYHVDGFRADGFAPREAIAGDPFLRCTKLFADSWEEALERRPKAGYPIALGDGKVTLRDKHLAEYNGPFEEDMRRLLKGDEGC